MPIIKQLSETTINRIAAGEVVERPASVVKELVENAIDAGATKIDITLEAAGKNLIIISDNGCGISKDDLPLAIQRHTTSKLNEDDIMDISSFGFRGEALPSIGSVARMQITSKALGHDGAFAIDIEGGNVSETYQAAHIGGTEVVIRDLFFATPARLKFLRSDRSEYSACLDIIKKIAMAHPSCSFSVKHNDKVTLKLKSANSQEERIAEILGEEFLRNSAPLSIMRDDVAINGFISIPTYNRATSEDQYLFINNRPVKDKLIAAALKVAYQDFLARDRFPVAAIFITTNPHFVDVNVHPAKTEVRFRDAQLMRGVLIGAIKDALGNVSHKVSDTTGSAMIQSFNRQTHEATKQGNYADSFSDYARSTYENSYKAYRPETKYYYPSSHSKLIDTEPHFKTEEAQERESSNIQNFPLGAACAQLHETYIISQTNDSIIITDQHAAHERLTYEKLKEQMAKNDVPTQRILVPEIVELPDEKRATALREKKEELAKMGLVFEIFGEKSVVVNELPQIIGDVDIKQLINDIADNLIEIGEDSALSGIIEHVTETYSCHHSIRAGRKLSIYEMNHLLREMEKTPFSGQCNHGRPTYIELKLKDIERLFGR